MATNVNFYKGNGFPTKLPAEGSFILNNTDKTMWYSDGTARYPIDKPGVTVTDYIATVNVPESITPNAQGYYIYECTVTGITSDDEPIADLYLDAADADPLTVNTILKEWNKVHKIETATDKVVVYAASEITIDFQIILKTIGVR